eukprot:scaffold96422_cov65-Phaeocystis_antarctica.AAC.2
MQASVVPFLYLPSFLPYFLTHLRVFYHAPAPRRARARHRPPHGRRRLGDMQGVVIRLYTGTRALCEYAF